MNMYKWLDDAIARQTKKPLPILSFPGIRYMEGVTIRQLVNSSRLQAECMKLVADKCDSAAAVSFMDLSVEAEAFGAEVCFFDDEVPAVRGALVTTMEEAEALPVPPVYTGRIGTFVEAIRLAAEEIQDRPVFAGAIGRTDHPGGDYDLLMESIFGKLMPLDGDITVIPGHGPCSDIATERMTNPFLMPFNEPYED